MTTEEYLERRKSKDWNFFAIVETDSFKNVKKIHPLKQKLVKAIVDAAKKDSYIRRIIIFGSSTRYDCDITSDLDICIEWTEPCRDKDGVYYPFTLPIRKVISKVTKGRADVINYELLDDTYLTEAVREGVEVYGNDV